MISVLTVKRPSGVTYLAETLAAIDASARSVNKIIVSDDPSIEFAGWKTIFHPKSQTHNNQSAAWVAIAAACNASEDLLAFEDDICMAPETCKELENLQIDSSVALVSLFSMLQRPVGIELIDARLLPSAVALKIPLATCQALIDGEHWVLQERVHGADSAIRHVGERLRWKVATLYPNPVQHIGVVSAAGHSSFAGRTSPTYLESTKNLSRNVR